MSGMKWKTWPRCSEIFNRKPRIRKRATRKKNRRQWRHRERFGRNPHVDTQSRAKENQMQDVVGLGGSAGSIGTLERFSRICQRTVDWLLSWCFIFRPEYESGLAGVLQKWTVMPVIQVSGADQGGGKLCLRDSPTQAPCREGLRKRNLPLPLPPQRPEQRASVSRSAAKPLKSSRAQVKDEGLQQRPGRCLSSCSRLSISWASPSLWPIRWMAPIPP
jgi:hypothetical protein